MRGNHIDLLAWAGFGLNVLLGLLLMHATASLPARDVYLAGNGVLTKVLPVLAILPDFLWGVVVGVQALSLAMLAFNIPGAVLFSWIGGLAMFPLGLLFIEGCMISRQRARFRGLAEDAPAPESDGLQYPNMAPENNPSAGIGIALCGLLLFALGVLDGPGAFMVFLGIVLALRGARLKSRPVLGLYRSYFTVTPDVWSDSYAVPYKRVTRSIVEEKRICLTVEDARASEYSITIPLRQIAPLERNEAANNFAARLAVDADMLARPGQAGPLAGA